MSFLTSRDVEVVPDENVADTFHIEVVIRYCTVVLTTLLVYDYGTVIRLSVSCAQISSVFKHAQLIER